MSYAAQLDENNVVIQVIVGTAEWANNNLGGVWVDCGVCGPGWVYVDGQMVEPPPPPEPEPEPVPPSD